MSFVPNARAVAEEAMRQIDPALAERYADLVEFLALHPEAASKVRGNGSPLVGSVDYIRQQARAFAASRAPQVPEPPATIPDEMVSFILHEYFDIPSENLERVKREHLLSMGAENLVGNLLERYLASVMEPRGWIWCSGSMVRAVDFIKPPSSKGGAWYLLQVKNRDNSENSSSSAIRNGTQIQKWHRTFSRRAGSNWAAFPDATLRPLLSEAGFYSFVKDYLANLKRR